MARTPKWICHVSQGTSAVVDVMDRLFPEQLNREYPIAEDAGRGGFQYA